MAITITLGNTAVIENVAQGDGTYDRRTRDDLEHQDTTMSFPDDWDPMEVVTAARNMWSHQSDAPPAWVESEDNGIAGLISAALSTKGSPVPVGRPDEKEDK